jgi:ATP-dependent Lhr-like helicase
VPSQFAHEFINAMPYSFLDPEDAAARRTRAVSLSKTLPDSLSDGTARIDPQAIATVREQLWPDVRDEHELHDLLLSLVVLPQTFLESEAVHRQKKTQHWQHFFTKLNQSGRARIVQIGNASAWIASERLHDAALLWPETIQCEATNDADADNGLSRERATIQLVQGGLQLLGPVTAAHLAQITCLNPRSLHQALLKMEMQGLAMRGVFEHSKPADDEPNRIEWCERRILHRIHRLTVRSLRQRAEPVSATTFMRWLLDWHCIAPPSDETSSFSGEEAVLAAIEKLEGFEAPAIEWERSLLPARVPNYDPRWLDNLCLAGIVGWGRLSPHPAWQKVSDSAAGKPAPRRVIPTSAAPITFYLRESAEWLHSTLSAKRIDEITLAQSLSTEAQCIRSLLAERGAAFTADLQRLSQLTKLQTTNALWELAAAGLASADGFDQLRAMMDPRRKSVALEQTPAVSLRKRAAARTTAGRWSLLWDPSAPPPQHERVSAKHLANATEHEKAQIIDAARHADSALEAHARILLARYGVVFRELLANETNAPAWRDLAPMMRRLEARGEVRGGRFVSGPFGEQFAVEEAAEGLRAARSKTSDIVAEIAAADPLNLIGALIPGDRVAAVPGRKIQLRNGNLDTAEAAVAFASASPIPSAAASLWSEAGAQ